ncbi:Zinc finger CCHC domain-containing protein 7 [Phytophthora nicotianae]|uniref:Zinc finger CCHC domain-containing protein 7 n=1 Tax=Phytophthora nicotianae TaxID=4792 RepID=A0A0W8DLQ4_PHYNI|nr:Zinc finger CCHC domain-containing protein 7 [Phytophthora nicotianae]
MIFRSRLPTLPIPDDASIWKVVEDHARTIGNKKAFICGITERSLTFAELLEQAKKVCAGLAANGLKKGDIVILHSFNCLEYVVVFLALNRLGAIISPSSPLFNGKELADQIEIAEAAAVISHKKFAKVAVEAAGLRRLPLSRVYTLGQAEGPSGLKTIEGLIAQNLPFPNIPPIDTNQVVTLPFSSGTTGRPKGVELTARAMYACGLLPAYREADLEYVLDWRAAVPYPALMKGYYKNPEANRVTFTADGFVRTGDVGYIDEDGYIFIVDRLKELIKYKGHQVAPAEVEDVVNSHPKVADSGCVRGFDPATGEEIPKAFVVLKEGENLSEQELMDYVAGKVTGYKRVREVEFIDVIPKSLSGKILRRELQIRQNEKIKAMQSRL